MIFLFAWSLDYIFEHYIPSKRLLLSQKMTSTSTVSCLVGQTKKRAFTIQNWTKNGYLGSQSVNLQVDKGALPLQQRAAPKFYLALTMLYALETNFIIFFMRRASKRDQYA